LRPTAQFFALFIAEFKQSLIIGHIIMTFRSCCRYHRDSPLVVEPLNGGGLTK
jgi:hypothetical protein